MEDDTNQSNKQYGIHRIFRFAKKKTNKVYVTDKKEIVNIENSSKATVAKVEFSNDNCFLLLSDGRVLSKGKEECLGRSTETQLEENRLKSFGVVEFSTEINQGVTSDESENITVYNISAGDEHVLALDFHYNVWAWGSNKYKQIHPKMKNDFRKPTKLVLPQDAKVCQIFSLNRTSMIICKNNIIYMWGSISEGFIGNFKDQIASGNKLLTDFVRMDKLSYYVNNDIKKYDSNFIETFINSRKLFNTKYNQTLEDNYNKQSRIDKLQTQIKNLRADIELRQRQNNQLLQSLSIKTNDKRILSLQELLRTYEDKLNKISMKKDKLRKELINVEDEINQKDLDLKSNNKQIDLVEDQMESFNNEITELKSKLSEDKDKKNEFTKLITEKNSKLYNLKIYKESLMNNLQVLIVFLETKEKERNEISKAISTFSTKENDYLKARYTVEDMIQVIQESITNSINAEKTEKNAIGTNNSMNNASLADKFKEKYSELFKYNERLDKLTFTYLNKIYPYKIIEDLLEQSNNELKVIVKELDISKSSLSELVKENMKIILDMLESKLELITEQNIFIRDIYNLLGNLEKEVKERELSKNKELQLMNVTKEKNSKNNLSSVNNTLNTHIEFIYKDLILKFLKEVYRQEEQNDDLISTEEKERLQYERNTYIQEKQNTVKVLENRNEHLEDFEKKFDLSKVVSFGYTKNDNNKGSMFQWMGNMFNK